MARESDDPWKRLRERENEAEIGELSLFEKRIKGTTDLTPSAAPSTDKLDSLIHSAQTLIEQINGLMNMFAVGVETRPPIERRRLLEKTMDAIMQSTKPTQAAMYHASSMNASFLIHNDKWERMLRDIDSGKIKRTVRKHAA